MIAGQAPLDSKVVRRIPEPEEEDTDTPEGNTSETVSGASAPTAEKTDVDIQTTTGKESAGFWRKKIALPVLFFRSDKLISFSVNVYNLDLVIILKMLAQLCYIDVHGPRIEIIVINPYCL